jgi:peptidyl-dipeptidase Dcp
MQKSTLFSKPIQLGLIAISLFAVACNSKKEEKTMTNESNNTNPLVQKWEDRYNGIPPFDKVKIEDFIPAEEMAIAEQRAEIKSITSNTAAPTFENTVEAMEKTGITRKRVEAVYYVWQSSIGSPALDSIQEILEPRIAGFMDSINQNSELFKRIETVYNSPEKEKLTPEQQRLCYKYYTNFVLAGAKLDDRIKS